MDRAKVMPAQAGPIACVPIGAGLEVDSAPKSGSRIPGFYKLGLQARQHELLLRAGLTPTDLQLLDDGCLAVAQADHMVENVIGTYALPLGLGLNFQVNGRDYLVPMCVEEPSVVAAASNAARMVRAGGGFIAEADEPLMIAQIHLVEVPDTTAAVAAILAEKAALIHRCNEVQPGLVRRGGGTRDLEVRVLLPSQTNERGMLVVHLLTDCAFSATWPTAAACACAARCRRAFWRPKGSMATQCAMASSWPAALPNSIPTGRRPTTKAS
jgi:hydroxymethylglutaryl-CoA reductase